MENSKITARRHDRLLDAIRSVAIVRVILWHTWSWAWLSWIPAMPAMFFTNGALLDMSLERRGWATTVAQRARRLLIPYWFYAALCWVAMLASGWRPRPLDVLVWTLPLADPVGAADLPGLWIPLWYIRAYVWFVILSGLFKAFEKRLGMWIVLIAAVGAAGTWAWSYSGADVPFALTDAFGYAPFLLAGMVYHSRGRIGSRRILLLCGVIAGGAAVVAWKRFGPPDAVVNRSYLLMLLVGTAGIALATAFRSPILEFLENSGRARRIVARLNSRALTIYLWQGFGLVAADRLVTARITNPVISAALSIVVVTAVVAAATILFGPLEDLAARRIRASELFSNMGERVLGPKLRELRAGVTFGVVALVVLAITLPAPVGHQSSAPLSGHAVVARAGLVEDSLDGDAAPNKAIDPDASPADVLNAWMADHTEEFRGVDLRYIDAVVVSPNGSVERASWGDLPDEEDDPLLWWSMTKTVTVAWLMRLVEAGTVSLDDRLSRWVPEVPNARSITLEHLARHTSGISGEFDSSLFDSEPTQEIARYKRSGKLSSRPGDTFSYSRIGYLLLGLALERASSVTWTDAVTAMADGADARISFDEDRFPNDRITDPDRHGYRGNLWASGGLVSSVDEAVKLIRWIFTEGLEPSSIDAMTRFSTDPDHWYYGIGLMPLCPCAEDDGVLRAARFGLDSATGTFAVDRNGAVVLVRPSWWFRDGEPVAAFYDLENRLLDLVSNAQAD